MHLHTTFFAVAMSLISTVAIAGDLVGHYKCKGQGPDGGSNYTGEVTVSRTGDTYKVVWLIGGTTYIGTGIGNDEFVAVSYKSGDQTGLALYGPDSDDWKGIWTYAGGKALGIEKWMRD